MPEGVGGEFLCLAGMVFGGRFRAVVDEFVEGGYWIRPY